MVPHTLLQTATTGRPQSIHVQVGPIQAVLGPVATEIGADLQHPAETRAGNGNGPARAQLPPATHNGSAAAAQPNSPACAAGAQLRADSQGDGVFLGSRHSVSRRLQHGHGFGDRRGRDDAAHQLGLGA